MSKTTEQQRRRAERRADREQEQRDRAQRRREREQRRADREQQQREREQRCADREQQQREREDQRERARQLRLLGAHAPDRHERARPTTIELGASAEDRAAGALVDEGYEIVERNYRCDVGELDIVARDGDDLVFVEVRSRSSTDHGGATEAVGPHKRRKVARVAEVYLRHKQPWFDTCRFDVVAIDGERAEDIEIYKDAWRGGLLF